MALVDQRPHQRFPHNDFMSKVQTSPKEKNGSFMRKSLQDLKQHEVMRLLSFAKFPREIPCSSILLARNGFMYTGTGAADDDTVTCVFCSSVGSNIRDLTSIDEIEVFHRKLNPYCSIVVGLDCGNKLIEVSGKGSFAVIFKQLYERRNKGSESILPKAEDNKLTCDDPNHIREADSSKESQSLPNEELHSSDASRCSATENRSSNFLQQAVEDGASSQVITNRAQSLHYPWQNIISEPVGSLSPSMNNVNDSFSPSAGESGSENTARPDGSAFSATSSNAPSRMPSDTTPFSNRNENYGTQSNQAATSTLHGQNSAASDSTRAWESENTRSNPQPSASNPQSSLQSSTSPHQDKNTVQDGVPAYEKLGICTARPKRPEYAVEQVRLQSFEGWPDDHHIKPALLAKAGYFYTGYGDCARCFFCGGGLRNWEEGDDVWVEHARWFQKCTFVQQNMGQTFINVVQDLNKEKETIPYQDVIIEMEARGLEIVVPRDIVDKSPELKRDIAVKTVLDNGFSMEDTVLAAGKLKEMGYSLRSDLIFEALVKMGARKLSQHVHDHKESGSLSTRGKSKLTQATMDSLINENNELHHQSQCKICLDKEVAVVFLPCGHFVSCLDCSYALKSCPICRESIKGVVRGYLS